MSCKFLNRCQIHPALLTAQKIGAAKFMQRPTTTFSPVDASVAGATSQTCLLDNPLQAIQPLVVWAIARRA
jgi:hypothetical protein